jgi:carbamoyl-phosphate synthase large subunit
VLEANPRASRTVPLVSKVCGMPMARIATQVMLGKKLSDWAWASVTIPHFGVKEAVFPFNMFPRSTRCWARDALDRRGAGLADSFGLAFYKAQEAAQPRLPSEGTVLISVADRDKPAVVEAPNWDSRSRPPRARSAVWPPPASSRGS